MAADIFDMTDIELSANEIEALVLKAARGGGLPLGLAEDLAAAVAYLDLAALRVCPCDSGAAAAIPTALDRVAAGEGAQTVVADHDMIEAYVASIEQQTGRTLIREKTDAGGVFVAFTPEAPAFCATRGRRAVPQALLDHLTEMAAKTLVPETECSRIAGAGAGLTDND